MGTTSKIYTTKQNLTLQQADQIVRQAHKHLAEGNDRSYRYAFNLCDLSKYNELKQRYALPEQNDFMLGITLDDVQEVDYLLALKEPYDRLWFYTNKKHNEPGPVLGYTIEIKTAPTELIFKINLPYRNIQESKTDLIRVVKHLLAQGTLYMAGNEVETVMNAIIDLNSSTFSESWAYHTYHFRIDAYPDVTPHGSHQARPSGVRFVFTKEQIARKHAHIHELAQQLNLHTSQCVPIPGNYEGLIYTQDIGKLWNATKNRAMEFDLSLSIDLLNNADYDIRELEQLYNFHPHEEHGLMLENFTWKGTDAQYSSNRVALLIEDDKFELEIEIDKYIDDSYVELIEQKIGYALKLVRMD